jgi:arsenite methyltransferase
MMLHDTRFAKYFDFYGTWDTHYGIFEGCGGNMPFTKLDGTAADCC